MYRMKKKDFLKRKISLLLAFILVFTSSMSEVTFNVKAEEQREPFSIYINNQSAASSEQLTFDYGVTLSPEVSGTNTATVLWITEADYASGNWKEWTEIPESPAPGKYYIGFNDFSENNEIEDEDRYAFIVKAAKLDIPTNLKWNNLVLSWTAVGTASVTGALPANAENDAVIDEGALKGYSVTLYKENVEKYTTSVTGTSIDLSEKITELGYGNYTAKVTADSADTSKYKDSDAAQEAFVYKDEVAPVIHSFAAGEGEHTGKLVASVTDAQTGIVGYAFTTKSDASELLAKDWNSVDTAMEIQTYTYSPENTGTYYFYAKDTEGNIAKSDMIPVTMIRYNDYYENGTRKTKLQALIGNRTVHLDTGMSRPGYVCRGWYGTEGLTGEPLEEIASDAHLDSGYIDVYAKWEKAEVTFSKNLSNIEFTYDGQDRKLEVILDDSVTEFVEKAKNGSISYQWYKKQGDGWLAIDGANTSIYTVKNVSDSGSYYVEVTVSFTDEQAGQVEDRYSSNTAVVTISPIELNLKVTPVTVEYLDAVLEYTSTLEGGFADGEDRESAGIKVVYSCDYVKGNGVDNYSITATASSKNNNYTFAITNGSLTVKSKDVEKADSGVTAKLEDTEAVYTYDKQEHTPAIVVTDGKKDGENQSVDADQYEIRYTDCVDAGTATATITFKGNYTGVKVVRYEINKADFKPEVSMEGWTFGESAKTPVITSNVSGGTAGFYYYEKGKTPEEATTTVPVNAGEYYVYAKVAETDNYNAQDSLVNGTGTPFTIAKRVITIVTENGSWTYDGNTHVAPGYTIIGDFVGTDDFKSIIITGSIVNVGSCENSVEYTLTSSTLPGNYDIQKRLGTLSVDSTQLATPALPAWDSDHSGRATWVAVTRDNLDVRYRVQLYRVTESGYEPVGEAVESDITYIDYLSRIKSDCENQNHSYSYVFDVVAIPYSGSSKGNYTTSDATPKSSPLATVLVSVGKDSGIEQVTINGQSGPVYLLKDESATIEATLKKGYTYSDPVWTTMSSYFTIANNKSAQTTIRVGNIPSGENSAKFTAGSVDKIPVITDFTASPIDGNSKVMFSFAANDELNITGWMINQSSTKPDTDAREWIPVNDETILVNTDQTDNVVSEKGTYYLWVKDSNGSVVGADAPIDVYRIQFADGGGTGTMPELLKVQNINITLPALAYENAGYYFKNWSGTTGIYEDRGIYVANKDDTLTATWTNQTLKYKVQYYYMNVNGTYDDAYESEADFNAHYGEHITAESEAIQEARAGFLVDSENFAGENGGESIQIVEDNVVVKMYYKRAQYKLTFSYVIPKSGEVVSLDTYVLYGAKVVEKESVEIPGYTFAGWSYGEAGSKPETMPNKDITATGTYVPKEAEYIINYYGQNVDCGNTYELLTEYTEVKKCLHDDSITFGKEAAREITGYTVRGISFSRGSVSGSDISTVSISDSCTGDASSLDEEKLYINVYYTRNKHSITLNVWKGTRDVLENNVYTRTWENIPYGHVFTDNELNEYKTYYESNYKDIYESDPEKGLSGFTLAQYTDWSTGNAPVMMPDGDVTISKDYVVAGDSRYYVEVYTERTDGKYNQEAKMVCYSSVGKYICYNPESTAIDSGDNYITYSELKNNMPVLAYYQYNPILSDPNNENYEKNENGDGCISGNVTDVDVKNEEPLTLRIYFERKIVTTQIRYYYANEDVDSSVKMYTVTKSGKWGTTYPIEADAYFDSNVDDRSVATSDYWMDAARGTVTDVKAETVVIDGVDGNTYDFRTNAYGVSYDERYVDTNGYHYPAPKVFLQEADFNNNYTGTFGYNSGNNYVNVYYVKVNPNKTYYVDVKYKTDGLHAAATKESIQLTCDIDGTIYPVRLANEKDVLEGSRQDVITEDSYPAGNYLRQMREPLQGEKTPKEGYTARTVTTSYGTETYYTKDGYIYILDTRNHLFYGNRASINLGNPTGCSGGINNAAAVGYSDIVEYLNAYISDEDNTDSEKTGAYIYNNGIGSMLCSTGEKYDYWYTFAYRETYSLNFILNGNTSTNSQRYVYNTTFTLEEMENFANIHFDTPIGKRIALYQDAQCTIPVDDVYVIKGNSYVYCRYEKAIYDNQYFISYELPNSVSVDGEETYYIDKNNFAILDDMIVNGEATTDVTNEKISLTNEYGIAKECNKTITKYWIDGELALVLVTVPGFANSEVSMNYADYAEAGYYYDDTNSNNSSNGYCMTEGVRLSAYYTRYKYNFTLNNNNEKINNAITTTYSYGRKVYLTEPSKTGYDFDGWEWSFSDTDLYWSSDLTDFVMPMQNLSATAKWAPAEFAGTVTHYFQTETQTYDTASLEKMLHSEDVRVCVVKMQDDFITQDKISDGKLYYDGDILTGVSFSCNGKVLYFINPDEKQDYYEVEASNLIAMTHPITETSEADVEVSKYAMEQSNPFATIFAYSFTICSLDSKTERYGILDYFTANAEMNVAYYYTRSMNNNIRAIGMATDNGAAGVTITGTGDHYYGESVTLSAVLGSGYELVGWYRAEDVLIRYEDSEKITYAQDLEKGLVMDLSEYQLDSDYDFTQNALKTDTSYSFKVTRSDEYVAVVSPKSVDGTSAEIVCNSSNITYGNISSTEDNLSLDIHLGNENVVVTGYQWYIKDGDDWKIIEGATSGVYNLDTSSDAGSYTFRCELSLKRSDNGRTASRTTAPYEVIIHKADMKIQSGDYEGVYDGLKHGISLKIDKPVSAGDYVIYYSDEKITKDSDFTVLSTDANSVMKKDVKYDAETQSVLAYDSYFYIKDKTGNYNDYAGHNTIKITPKNITVKAATNGFSYSKVYDGDTLVHGEIDELDTDKGRLANGVNNNSFYIINGIVNADTAIGNATYIIDFVANYNYSHVATATALELTDMKLITVMDGEYFDNYNYYFSTSSTLTLSAYITPYPIATIWNSDTIFTYDGKAHQPTVTIGDRDKIPDGAENIELVTSGEQVNAGNYYASVTINIKEGVTGIYSSDYKAQTEKKAYSIKQRTLTVTPSGETADIYKVYNGENQTINTYDVTGLVEGELVEYSPNTSRKNAGTVQIKAKDVKVFTVDAGGNKSKDISDNYDIVCPEQTLTIQKNRLRSVE